MSADRYGIEAADQARTTANAGAGRLEGRRRTSRSDAATADIRCDPRAAPSRCAKSVFALADSGMACRPLRAMQWLAPGRPRETGFRAALYRCVFQCSAAGVWPAVWLWSR